MNIKQSKKWDLIGAITLVTICCVIFTSTYFGTFAQGTNDNTEETKEKISCTFEMRPVIAEESQKFRDYMQSHLQNKSTNSSLLDLMLKRFQLYKNTLRDKYNTYGPQVGLSQYTETADLTECYKQMQTEIDLMEALMRKYFVETSNIKTSSALMTKIQNINAKLDKLSRNVNQMYGKWESLQERIPCFTDKCL
jgi:hypothetical protein